MIKTLKNLFKQDKERFLIPNGVQDVIPIRKIYDDGVFQVGDDKFSKTYKFTDINTPLHKLSHIINLLAVPFVECCTDPL